MMLRRSLLAAAPLLILPCVARGLGSRTLKSRGIPCTPITTATTISTAGCYVLGANVTGGILILANDVTLIGGGYTLDSLIVGQFSTRVSGVLIQDLTVSQNSGTTIVTVWGNDTVTQTAPAVHFNRVTISNLASAGGVGNPMQTSANNILIEHCVFTTYASPSNPPPVGTDDPLAISGVHLGAGNNTVARWVVVDSCTFGPSFDLGIEGIDGGWDHCTISNCVATGGAFGGFGGFFLEVGDPTCGFVITNNTFMGNTLHNGWRFCTPQGGGGGVGTASSDAAANAAWGTGTAFGNVFSGNTYV
jgi:hypothetical protein